LTARWIVGHHLPNTRILFFAVQTLAFLGVSSRIVNRWASLRPTLRQRVCKPHFAASDLLEQTTMATQTIQSPLALRPREAAKALGISPRLLWQLTHDGEIPCVRVGSGKRKTVLYPTTTLKAWLSRQAEVRKGDDDDAC
jgi:excisionase family DNA binding protein